MLNESILLAIFAVLCDCQMFQVKSCARLKNCHLVLCSMCKTISTDCYVACTRPQLCSISCSSSVNRPQCSCYYSFFASFRVPFLMPRVCFKSITWYIKMHHVKTFFLCGVVTFSCYVMFIQNMFIFFGFYLNRFS